VQRHHARRPQTKTTSGVCLESTPQRPAWTSLLHVCPTRLVLSLLNILFQGDGPEGVHHLLVEYSVAGGSVERPYLVFIPVCRPRAEATSRF
jgi:hypothetical protein